MKVLGAIMTNENILDRQALERDAYIYSKDSLLGFQKVACRDETYIQAIVICTWGKTM